MQLQYFYSYRNFSQATAEANNLSAVAEAREVYETLMEEICGGAKPYLQPRTMEEEHRRARDKALHAFHSKKKMGGQELADSYGAELIKVRDKRQSESQSYGLNSNLFTRIRPDTEYTSIQSEYIKKHSLFHFDPPLQSVRF